MRAFSVIPIEPGEGEVRMQVGEGDDKAPAMIGLPFASALELIRRSQVGPSTTITKADIFFIWSL